MFGGAAQQQTPQGRSPQQPQNPLGDSPWGKILQDMLGGQMGGQADGPARTQTGRQQSAPQQRRAPQPDPQQNPNGQRNPYDDLFGRMFETGRQQRDDYEKNMGSVFDQFLRGMDRR